MAGKNIFRINDKIESCESGQKKWFKTIHRKMYMVIAIWVSISTFVIVADGIQQRKFSALRTAYGEMEQKNYKEAIKNFELYLNGKSKIYWELVDICNGIDSSYTYNNAFTAKKYCKEMLMKDE